MLYYSMPALAAGFILDLMIGDPRWLYHPVCLIGNLIAFLEKILRKIFPKTDKGELAAGTVEVILVCLLSGGIPFLILHILYGISVWAGFALETFWCYQLLATKSLKTESMKVYDRLKNGTLDEARYAVSMIVGRDTQSLTEEGVTKAAVETVAENASAEFPRGRQSLPKNIKLRMPCRCCMGVRLYEISWTVKRERAQTCS